MGLGVSFYSINVVVVLRVGLRRVKKREREM